MSIAGELMAGSQTTPIGSSPCSSFSTYADFLEALDHAGCFRRQRRGVDRLVTKRPLSREPDHGKASSSIRSKRARSCVGAKNVVDVPHEARVVQERPARCSRSAERTGSHGRTSQPRTVQRAAVARRTTPRLRTVPRLEPECRDDLFLALDRRTQSSAILIRSTCNYPKGAR